MERLDYAEIIDKLGVIHRQLCEMGLPQYNRIRVHQGNLTELAQASDEGRIPQVADGLSGERRREILWSFVESIELVDSFDALQKRGCSIPKHVLERALKGPADLYLEDQNSNLGRNTMFEIALAGSLARVGLNPRLGDEPDVLFEFGGRRIFVQCKRLLSENAIRNRIADAARQLKRDLSKSGDPRDCGVIGISVSRLVNPGDRILVFANEAEMQNALRREIAVLIQRHEKALRGVGEPKIAGAILHLATPVYLNEHSIYSVAHSATIYHMPGKSDASLLKSLAKSLRF